MARKIIMSVSLLICTFFFTTPVVAGDLCEESTNTVCIGCHNADRVCENLGASAKTWKSILKWMESNIGEEFEQDEFEALVKCFSEPSAGAKAATQFEKTFKIMR